jgi:phosphatidylglycerophosphate synthase
MAVVTLAVYAAARRPSPGGHLTVLSGFAHDTLGGTFYHRAMLTLPTHLASRTSKRTAVVDLKDSDSFLAPLERRVARWALQWVPSWLESHHLTLLTLIWSGLVLSAASPARHNPRWLWVVSLAIALQYATDAVDGKVGQIRNAGLMRWGYYMDHFLDYVFLCAILLTYSVLLPPSADYLMTIVLAIAGAFMVSAFLARAVTGVLTISFACLGPVEMRLIFIAINTWLATVGRADMLRVVPYVIGAALVVLAAMVFKTQRRLWRLDAEARASARTANPDRLSA